MAGEENDEEGAEEIYVTASSRRPSLEWKMRKSKLNNEVLDAVGRSLVAADKMTDTEIEMIVASPHLYTRVRARINSGTPQVTRRIALSPAAAVAFGSVVLAIGGIVGFGYLGQKEPAVFTVREIRVPVTAPETARPKVPPEPVVNESTTGRAFNSEVRFEKAVVRQPVRRTEPRPQPVGVGHSEQNFYALTYAGDPYETARGGRVIRVDVPRSTLFAMGVDLPLENESPTVKADLLVGPDGVTRAIRIVN